MIKFQYLIAPIIACFLAQFLKVILPLFKGEKMKFHRFFETGGMPSSHSSTVVALVLVVGIYDGFSSSLFAVATVFAGIVIYDAVGLRQAVGKQAKALNKTINLLKKNNNIKVEDKLLEKELKESVGHTLLEVIAGGILGALIVLIIIMI